MSKQGLLSTHIWRHMQSVFQKREVFLLSALQEVLSSNPSVEIEELDTARQEALRVQRSAIGGLFRDGMISEDIHEELIGEVDQALTEDHVNWSQLLQMGSGKKLKITKMMAVVIQENDFENALKGLSNAGFGVDRLPSTGGFLSQHNVTLLIGIPEKREADVVPILKRTCKKRVKYIRTPIEGAFLPFTRPIPVEIGGATIFTFEIEAYHEF